MNRLFWLLGCMAVSGCGLFEWPGTYVPRGDNAENLRLMVANPGDLRMGESAATSRGAAAALPVDRLLIDKRKPIPNVDILQVGNTGGASAQPQ